MTERYRCDNERYRGAHNASASVATTGTRRTTHCQLERSTHAIARQSIERQSRCYSTALSGYCIIITALIDRAISSGDWSRQPCPSSHMAPSSCRMARGRLLSNGHGSQSPPSLMVAAIGLRISAIH